MPCIENLDRYPKRNKALKTKGGLNTSKNYLNSNRNLERANFTLKDT